MKKKLSRTTRLGLTILMLLALAQPSHINSPITSTRSNHPVCFLLVRSIFPSLSQTPLAKCQTRLPLTAPVPLPTIY